MHPHSQVNMVCTSLLRNNVKSLDISSEIFTVHWMEDEPELRNEVAYHWRLSTAKVQDSKYPYLQCLAEASRCQAQDSRRQCHKVHEGNWERRDVLVVFEQRLLFSCHDKGIVAPVTCTIFECDRRGVGDGG